jgi:tRNA U34 5-methylaminomethyl-2-thiouridine-forming methyltransferase MnmC
MMKRELMLTEDGSHTIYIPSLNITYHSTHGAIQESVHIFINAGLKPLAGRFEILRVFEMGFGTGLNALLALQLALQTQQQVVYTTVELYPLEEHEYSALNYCTLLQNGLLQPYFTLMHEGTWGQQTQIHPLFLLQKLNQPIETLKPAEKYDCIFFDAFAPNDQPELWDVAIFKKMFGMLQNSGILVTYCSKGYDRRALSTAGFAVQKMAGPPGKREIVKAVKP